MTCLLQIPNGVELGMRHFLSVMGLSVISGLLRSVNFADGAFYLLGAYLTCDLTQRDFSLWLAVQLAPLIVAGVAALTEAVPLGPINKLPHMFHILVTMGIALLIQEFFIIVCGPVGTASERATS